MGFMSVFVFFIITAEVHTHNNIPTNGILKASRTRKLPKKKRELLVFLFLVSFFIYAPDFFSVSVPLVSLSVSVLLVFSFAFGLNLRSRVWLSLSAWACFRLSFSVPFSRYYLPSS